MISYQSFIRNNKVYISDDGRNDNINSYKNEINGSIITQEGYAFFIIFTLFSFSIIMSLVNSKILSSNS